MYIIAAVVIGIFVLKFIFGGKKPKNKTFTCARCKTVEKYSPRTIEAWRRGFNKIYCQQCHKLWLQNNPNHNRQNVRYSGGSGGGCLSVLVIGVFVPISIFILSKYVS